MASSTFKFNGNIPNIVTFNGNDVKVLVYNNVTVWKKIITIDVPTTTSSFTYNGSSQSPVWSGYDSSKMTMGGSSSGTNAGTYTTTFTPNEGYAWPDESTTAKSVSWSIGQLSISGATVTLSNSLTYNGSAQTQNVSSVSISGLSATYSVSGNTGTNAGSYTLTCTGTGNFTGTQTASWSIGKASGYVSLSSTSGSVNKNSSITFTVNSYSGSLSVGSSNTGVATTSISGATVYVNGVSSGNSCTIYVYVAESTNYYGTSASYSVYVNYVWYRYKIQYNWGKYNCTATASGYSKSSSATTINSSNLTYSSSYMIRELDNATYGAFNAKANYDVSFDSSTGLYTSYCNGSYVYNSYAVDAMPLAFPRQSQSGFYYLSNTYYVTSNMSYVPSIYWGISYSGTTPYLSITKNSRSSDFTAFTLNTYSSYVSSYTYSQGSYITSVSSTSSTAYSNGHNSDGYWYQSTSSTNSGSYVDTVASSSSSAYADNGISGSYWCVKQ